MHNRSDQPEMTSACQIYEAMLKRPPMQEKKITGGGAGLSTSGNIVFIPSDTIKSYDADTNALLRAKCACDLGLVVSPLSNQKSTLFYTTKENFQTEFDQAIEQKKKADERWEKRCGPFIISGRKNSSK